LPRADRVRRSKSLELNSFVISRITSISGEYLFCHTCRLSASYCRYRPITSLSSLSARTFPPCLRYCSLN
jgi:hypothetical protein